MAWKELYLSAKLATRTTQKVKYEIPNGKMFRIVQFYGETATNSNCAIVVIWDSEGTETPLWAIKGSNQMPDMAGPSTKNTGDGSKQIALYLDNMSDDTVYMAGFAKIWIQD